MYHFHHLVTHSTVLIFLQWRNSDGSFSSAGGRSYMWLYLETIARCIACTTRRALDGHVHLRQRCLNVSTAEWIKTILKPRVSAAAVRANTYARFSRRKIPPISADTISEKAIRFRHSDYDPGRFQKLIISSMSRHLSIRNI